MERFYYSRTGTDVQGPITDDDLWKMVQAGILPPSVQVCREGTKEWAAVHFPVSAASDGSALEQTPTPGLSPVVHEDALALTEEEEITEDEDEEESDEEKGERVIQIIRDHSLYAMGAMMIPLPGVDVGATMGVWGGMIVDIAKVYGYEVGLVDAKRLGSDLFKSVVLTTGAWFASAKTASFVCKFIPFAGTATAFVIDTLVASIGAKGITARLGTAAALYYQSGKTMAPETMAEHVKNVAKDSNTIRIALGLFTVGEAADMADDDSPPHHHHRA